jgi:hypothetical protein
MEGLITNATKTANLRRDQCAYLTQQVNHEVVEMSIAEATVQHRFTDFSVRPLSFGGDASGPNFSPRSALERHNDPWLR